MYLYLNLRGFLRLPQGEQKAAVVISHSISGNRSGVDGFADLGKTDKHLGGKRNAGFLSC